MAAPLTEQQIRQLVKQEIQAANSANRFQLTGIPSGNRASPYITSFSPTQIYTGNITSTGGGTYPKDWSINHGIQNVTFTAAFVGGETSGTLTTAWPDSEIQSPITPDMTFSNGDVRAVTVTFGSTAVSWSGVLSGAATVHASTVATGLYLINHNLGSSTTYTAVVTPDGFPTDVNTPYVANIEINPDVLDVCTFSISTPGLVNIGFSFVITVINNKNVSPPVYKV